MLQYRSATVFFFVLSMLASFNVFSNTNNKIPDNKNISSAKRRKPTAYLFSDNRYIIYNSDDDMVYHQGDLLRHFGIPSVDAAVIYNQTRKLYLFYGNRYLQYDLKSRVVDSKLRLISEDWPGVNFDRIDAALNYGNGIIYFFRKDEYVRFNIANNQTEGRPKKIGQYWPGLTKEGFDKDIDSAINWKYWVYFFKGDEYVLFDIRNNNVDYGYPKKTKTYWKGVGDYRIRAAARPLDRISPHESNFVVGPYLQNVTPTTAWIMWEDQTENNQLVEYGRSINLGKKSVRARSKVRHPRADENRYVHQAYLRNLKPGRIYYYRITVNGNKSPIYSFRTPPSPNAEKSFRFAVYSDTQWYSKVHKRIVDLGLVGILNPNQKIDQIHNNLAFVLVPGDLVHNGNAYVEYRDRFFGPISSISGYIPYYPAIGNHEYKLLREGEDPTIYLNYFHLPTNGINRFQEHWYSFDYSNAHVITLNSNLGSETNFEDHPRMYNAIAADKQLKWLEEDLKLTCKKDYIDFVFVQLHHSLYSEFWVTGTEPYAQQVGKILEKYLNYCHKAGAIFSGHTHAYSRGQSKNASLYYATVATAGGRLDRWNEYQNQDYINIQKSLSSFGFVIVEVEAGTNPSFKTTRYGQGNEERKFPGNLVEDIFYYRKNAYPPKRPTPVQKLYSLNSPIILKASRYFDLEGDYHLETQWQIEEMLKDNNTLKLIYDSWERFENWYKDIYDSSVNYRSINTREDSDLTEHIVPFHILHQNRKYRWRVRYRDNSLKWSDWSKFSDLSLQ